MHELSPKQIQALKTIANHLSRLKTYSEKPIELTNTSSLNNFNIIPFNEYINLLLYIQDDIEDPQTKRYITLLDEILLMLLEQKSRTPAEQKILANNVNLLKLTITSAFLHVISLLPEYIE